jgi:tripartite-type tricarboxylate transporter receptor subunit TctC
LPGVPTVAEAGVPGYESATIQGLFVPAKTAAPLVARIHRDVAIVMNRPEYREKLLALASEVVAGTPAEFAAVVRADMARLGTLIGEAGIKAD